jgi:hypothetical protein
VKSSPICTGGHAGVDVLRFFKKIDDTAPLGLSVHVVFDNRSADSTPEIKKWLAHRDRRRWHPHFTLTSSFWLKLIERWFKELADRRLRRGVFTSVADLSVAITHLAHALDHRPEAVHLESCRRQHDCQSPTRTRHPHQIKRQRDYQCRPYAKASRSRECLDLRGSQF